MELRVYDFQIKWNQTQKHTVTSQIEKLHSQFKTSADIVSSLLLQLKKTMKNGNRQQGKVMSAQLSRHLDGLNNFQKQIKQLESVKTHLISNEEDFLFKKDLLDDIENQNDIDDGSNDDDEPVLDSSSLLKEVFLQFPQFENSQTKTLNYNPLVATTGVSWITTHVP